MFCGDKITCDNRNGFEKHILNQAIYKKWGTFQECKFGLSLASKLKKRSLFAEDIFRKP